MTDSDVCLMVGYAHTMQDRLGVVVADVLETSRPRFARPITEGAWLQGCSAVWQCVEASKDLDNYERLWAGVK